MRRQARIDPLRQPPLGEERANLGDAQIAFLAHALAQDVEQYRPLAFHQLAVDSAPPFLAALEIRIHVVGDFAGVEPDLEATAHWITPFLAEGGKARDLVFMDMGLRIQDARADPMFVERTIAQFIERGAGPRASDQAERIEAVGDESNQPGLDAGARFRKSRLAAGGLHGLGQHR